MLSCQTLKPTLSMLSLSELSSKIIPISVIVYKCSVKVNSMPSIVAGCVNHSTAMSKTALQLSIVLS